MSDGSQILHKWYKFTHRAHPDGGLKRFQTVSKGLKCHDTLGAEHTRASHTVSQRRETLGAERTRVLHAVSECSELLGAERTRALQ